MSSVAEIIEGLLAGPGCVDLSEYSVDIVVSLDCSCRPVGVYKSVCVPIRDYGVEPLSNAARALRRIHEELDVKRHSVYVHCRAGCGRTGTIVVAFLVLFRDMTLGNALNLFYSKRLCGPESWEQHKFLDVLWRMTRRGIPWQRILEVMEEASDLGGFMGVLAEDSLR